MTAIEFCPSCGTRAGSGAFCTGCGARVAEQPVAVPVGASAAVQPTEVLASRAPDALAGRACPYCRFPLKEAAEIVECRSCHAVHHADCWGENSGCAINGCSTAADPAPPPTPAPAPVQSPAVTAAWAAGLPGSPGAPAVVTAPEAPRRGMRNMILALVAILVLGGSGAALYVALSKKSHTTVVNAPAGGGSSHVQVPNTDTRSGVDPSSGGAAPPSNGLLPDVPQSQMRSDIQDMLLTWHEDIKSGDYQEAWDLLTRRKQRQDLGEPGGYDAWVKAQASLGEYLDPSTIHVSIAGLQRSEGVARVKITGMGWSKPGSSCSTWSGITWVKYEGSEWRYDPGYSTTVQRRSVWQPREGELLGWGC
jgi:Prokaryotic RING finger family 1